MTDNAPKGRRQLLVILLFILVGIGVFMLAFHLYRHTFSRQRWLAEPEFRQFMLKNLEGRYALAGMTMEEVTALLGEEDSQQSSFKLSGSGTVYPPESTLVYYVGTESMEDLWFILSFEDGVCVAYTLDVT